MPNCGKMGTTSISHHPQHTGRLATIGSATLGRGTAVRNSGEGWGPRPRSPPGSWPAAGGAGKGKQGRRGVLEPAPSPPADSEGGVIGPVKPSDGAMRPSNEVRSLSLAYHPRPFIPQPSISTPHSAPWPAGAPHGTGTWAPGGPRRRRRRRGPPGPRGHTASATRLAGRRGQAHTPLAHMRKCRGRNERGLKHICIKMQTVGLWVGIPLLLPGRINMLSQILKQPELTHVLFNSNPRDLRAGLTAACGRGYGATGGGPRGNRGRSLPLVLCNFPKTRAGGGFKMVRNSL